MSAITDVRPGLQVHRRLLLVLAILLPAAFANADTQRVIDYEYDAAGNLVRIRSGRNLAPPDVTALSPSFVHRGESVAVVATGTNLFHAEVSHSVPGVMLSNIQSTESSVSFTVTADLSAAVGPVVLEFSTRLGSDFETFTVAERVPIISSIPNPIVLPANSQPKFVTLGFDAPYTSDQVFFVTTRDPAVATVNQTEFTLPAGATEVAVEMAGQVSGTTALDVTQPSNFLGLAVPVIVNANLLPTGTYTFAARPVGVAAYVAQSVSTPGVFPALPLGVGAYVVQNVTSSGVFVALPVGVGAYTQQSLVTSGIFTAVPTGTLLGAVIDSVAPATVARGTSATLTLTGVELDTATAVAFSPAADITVTGPLSPSPDGTQLHVPISVAAGAATGTRFIVLTVPAGAQIYSGGNFQIVP